VLFSRCIPPVENSTFVLWNGKIPRKRRVPSLLIPQLISFSLTSLPKLLLILSPAMDPFNALSTATTARKIPLFKEAPPAKVMSCALVTSTDLEKTLDVAKEVTGGAVMPSVKMASRPWLVANRSPKMRANHQQRAKVPPVSKVVKRARLMLFPHI
jgi:hypothetical protein